MRERERAKEREREVADKSVKGKHLTRFMALGIKSGFCQSVKVHRNSYLAVSDGRKVG